MHPALPNFDELWDYNKPAETERKFRALLPLAEQSSAPSYLAQLLTQIARAEGLQRKFAAAHQTLDRFQKSLAFEQAEGKADLIRIARWTVARAQRSLGQIETALATQRALLQEVESSGASPGYIFEELGECLLVQKSLRYLRTTSATRKPTAAYRLRDASFPPSLSINALAAPCACKRRKPSSKTARPRPRP